MLMCIPFYIIWSIIICKVQPRMAFHRHVKLHSVIMSHNHRFTYAKGVHSYGYFLPANSFVISSCMYHNIWQIVGVYIGWRKYLYEHYAILGMYWRASRNSPSLSLFLPKWRHSITSCDIIMPRRDIMWQHMLWQSESTLANPSETVKSRLFSRWWSWPLTYDLDLQTRPRYLQCQSSCRILGLYVKEFGRESAD